MTVLPQLREKSKDLQNEHAFSFEMLEDKGNVVAEEYGLTFRLGEAAQTIHQNFGMDIPQHNGDSSYSLPFAATYGIRKDGEIAYSYVNANWMERAEPGEVMKALAI